MVALEHCRMPMHAPPLPNQHTCMYYIARYLLVDPVDLFRAPSMRPGTFGVPESLDLPFTTQTIGIFLAKENFFPYLPTVVGIGAG